VAFRVDVVLDPFTREKISVPIPLDFTPPPERAREELGLGAFVDLKDPWMARAAALLRLAHRGSDPPIPLALLGGAGYRLLSPTANDEASGLRRPLHDLDLACRSKDRIVVVTMEQTMPYTFDTEFAVKGLIYDALGAR